MLKYYAALAQQSIGKNPGLSFLIAFTFGIGIASCVITYALIYLMSADPLPGKSERVYRIQLDNWPQGLAAIKPDLPPEALTWRDANNLVKAQQAKYQAASSVTWGMVIPADDNISPFQAVVRATHGDFFRIFNVPFLYGQPWENYPVNQAEYITVLSKESNDKLFAGENSVGQTIPMLGKLFKVVGVLDDWHVSPRFYDISFGAFEKPEDFYIPLQIKAELQLPNGGFKNCWEDNLEEGYDAFLNSECTHFKLWIELEETNDKAQYSSFLKQYVEEQKLTGRFQKPMDNRILNVQQWLAYKEVVSRDIYLFFWLSILFLFVCLFNAASLISATFATKIKEIALRRALGASQKAIFNQYIFETLCLGLLGGLIGLIISVLGIEGISLLYKDFSAFLTLDLNLILFALTLSILSSLAAGIVPILRVCKLSPAGHLK